ncbi:MAG: hypothetical protein AB7U83_06595 [Vicinamibacterales bacterium]
MSGNVWRRTAAIGVIVLAGIAGPGAAASQPAATCSDEALAALTLAAADAAAGDGAAAAARLRATAAVDPDCEPLTVASWSWHGWLAAQRADLAGGSADALADVRTALDTLQPGGRAGSLAARYAAAVLHAAAAAAQHERDEMRVWLEHAAGLAPRLPPDSRPWPLPLPIVEGELWLAVDDFELAEAAFARAGDRSPIGLRGVARTRARRGTLAEACAPFRAALALVEPTRPDGPLAVEGRAFLRLCP